MQGFVGNIENLTEENSFFRKVVFTGEYCQLVVMNLKVGEDIGLETHKTVDQFFRIETGQGMVIINGEETVITAGSGFIVPAGSQHNVSNTGNTELKLYTVYSPPNHPNGTIHKTKQEAVESEH